MGGSDPAPAKRAGGTVGAGRLRAREPYGTGHLAALRNCGKGARCHFAIWNAAPPDQQTDYLKGDETIELVNLCRPGSPGSRTDEQGDTRLTLTLPRHECYAFVRLHSGEVFRHPLRIDTVIVEPEERRLSLVWRAILVKDEELTVRAADLGMETFEDRDALERKVDQLMRVFPIDKLELTDE